MDAVVLENLNKSFAGLRAVADLSARIPAGSIYGFLGPNGAGKTTTMRMIMDIIRPDSGRIEVLGYDRLADARARIGYMPEERGLYRKMTVKKTLSYFAAIRGLGRRELASRVRQWLERIDLADKADKKVEELSRGMQQKLQFAVTAVNDPDLLILDEPFSGLDPINTDLLKAIILQMRSAGKTVIFSTHVMYQAEKLCDSIILINRGRVVLDEELLRIRARHDSRTVALEAQGQTDFIARLPMVADVRRCDDHLEVSLGPGFDTQELLAALAPRLRILRFEVKVPSLHEIFVTLVGRADA